MTFKLADVERQAILDYLDRCVAGFANDHDRKLAQLILDQERRIVELEQSLAKANDAMTHLSRRLST